MGEAKFTFAEYDSVRRQFKAAGISIGPIIDPASPAAAAEGEDGRKRNPGSISGSRRSRKACANCRLYEFRKAQMQRLKRRQINPQTLTCVTASPPTPASSVSRSTRKRP